jgi:hypothetical protein
MGSCGGGVRWRSGDELQHGGVPLRRSGGGAAVGRRRWRRRISPPELVDVGYRVRDRGFGIGPGHSEFQDGKNHAIDDDGRCIGSPDSGVPQIASSLEGFDVKTAIRLGHAGSPVALEPNQTIFSHRQM